MIILCSGEATSSPWTQCWCSNPCLGLTEFHNHRHEEMTITTTQTNRANFAHCTKSTIFADTKFNSHESLPSLSDAYASFIDAYPEYNSTRQADRIREAEYRHLADHVCLDYTGLCLFSHEQLHSSMEPSSSKLQPPFFSISCNSASLKSQMQYGTNETGVESAMRNRIMRFLNMSEEDYTMVCTANRTSAFKLLAETYPFQSNKRLLTVYDYESEAASAMAESASNRGAKVMSASFSWPHLRIQSAKLKSILSKRGKKKKRGLLVFPLQSRMAGTSYPYFWMRMAQENGWHVLLDASALGPKDMNAFGLSLIRPDFIICSFFQLVGENPSGFAGLFIKKSCSSVLETSAMATSVGIVSIVPAQKPSQQTDDFSSTTSDLSGPVPALCYDESAQKDDKMKYEQGEISEERGHMASEEIPSESETQHPTQNKKDEIEDNSVEIECKGLDHADSLGLVIISCRLRCITNWLVLALTKLQHPNTENGHSLVRIYGPRIRFDRGAALAFNVFDWKGEKVEPVLVQKLADRSNISLSCGFLCNIYLSDKYEADRDVILERKVCQVNVSGNKRKENISLGIAVVNASLGFLTNFEDAYKLWSFVAKFLDADFVEKERWRYMTLNQTMVEL